MRRRRRTKLNWLPVYGAPNAGSTQFSSVQEMALDVPHTGPNQQVVGWTPIVVNDVPNQVSEEDFPLNDIIGNEYILKRIVGKVFVDLAYNNDTGAPVPLIEISNVIVAAGFFVARFDPTANEPFNPVAATTQGVALYSPLNSSLMREPWIWRRTWLLGPGAWGVSQGATAPPSQNIIPPELPNGNILSGGYPSNNTQFPGVLDGPHIDAKTGRRVRQDEGLFFSAAAHIMPFSVNAADHPSAFVNIHLDVRCLGALRRSKNRSAF